MPGKSVPMEMGSDAYERERQRLADEWRGRKQREFADMLREAIEALRAEVARLTEERDEARRMRCDHYGGAKFSFDAEKKRADRAEDHYQRACDRAAEAETECAALREENARLKEERDRETELRRRAEEHARMCKVLLEQKPYPDELDAALSRLTSLRAKVEGMQKPIDCDFNDCLPRRIQRIENDIVDAILALPEWEDR